MSSDVMSRTLSIHQEHEFLAALERAGLTGNDAQAVITSPQGSLAKLIIGLIRENQEPAPTPSGLSAEQAARIMGINCLAVDKLEQHYGVKLTAKQRKQLKVVPFTAETLAKCAQTHILVAGYPLTTALIHGKASQLFYAKDKPWYTKPEQSFGTTETVQLGWYLVRKTILPGSTSKYWFEQQNIVGEHDYIPSASLVAYTAILLALAIGEQLYPSILARTSSVAANGNHVNLGHFDSAGLLFNSWDDDPSGSIGLASARTPYS